MYFCLWILLHPTVSAKYPAFQYLCFDLPAEYLHYFRHAILLIYLNFSTNCRSPVLRRKHCMELTSLLYTLMGRPWPKLSIMDKISLVSLHRTKSRRGNCYESLPPWIQCHDWEFLFHSQVGMYQPQQAFLFFSGWFSHRRFHLVLQQRAHSTQNKNPPAKPGDWVSPGRA